MFEKILLPIDQSDAGSWHKAFPTAVEMARKFGSALHVMTVVPDVLGLPNLPEDYGSAMIPHAEERLDEIVKGEAPDDVSVTQSVRQGTVYREILEEAETIGADLVVMRSHHPDVKNFLLGSNAAKVVRHAHVSVLVVRD